MLISETKLGPDTLNSEFVPEGYMGRFHKNRKRGAEGVMIITKECYKIVDADITFQNESVWAIVTLKDLTKLVILSEACLKQMQREPTRDQNLLDLFCCNKPSLTSIPGISDHNIVLAALADCKLKPSIITKPQRKIYQWSKADWRSIREQTVVLLKTFWHQQLPEVLMKLYQI